MNTAKIQFAALAAAALLLAACGSRKDEVVQETVEKIQEREGVPVVVSKAQIRKLDQVRVFSGSVEGHLQKSVYAAQPEEIKEILVQVGDVVAKDQIVAKLDRNGNTATARQMDAQYKVTKANVERVRELYKAGGVSKQQLDEAEAGLASLEAQKDAVDRMMEIRSPIAGVVTDVYVRQGNVAVVGRDEHPLLQVADISKMVLTIPVTGGDIHYFKKGKKAKVRVADQTVEGTVTKVPMAASASSRLFNVEITFNNSKKLLRPGMFVQAEVVLSSQDAVSAENDAFVVRGDSVVIFKVDGDRAFPVRVKKGETAGAYTAFEGQVNPGDAIAVDGMSLLKEGSTKVKIVSGD